MMAVKMCIRDSSCSNPQGGTSPVIFSAACPAVLPPLSRRCPVLLPAHYCSERTYLQTVSAPDAVLLLYFKGHLCRGYTRLRAFGKTVSASAALPGDKISACFLLIPIPN